MVVYNFKKMASVPPADDFIDIILTRTQVSRDEGRLMYRYRQVCCIINLGDANWRRNLFEGTKYQVFHEPIKGLSPKRTEVQSLNRYSLLIFLGSPR